MVASEGRLIRPLLGAHARADRRLLRSPRAFSGARTRATTSERYARARVRNGLVPALRAVHPAAEANVLRTAALLREETELLDGLVADELGGRPAESRSRACRRCRRRSRAWWSCAWPRRPPAPTCRRRATAWQEILALGRRGGRAELHVGGQAGAVIGDGVLRMMASCRRATTARELEAPVRLGLDSSSVATPARLAAVEPGVGEVLVTAEDLQRRVARAGRGDLARLRGLARCCSSAC